MIELTNKPTPREYYVSREVVYDIKNIYGSDKKSKVNGQEIDDTAFEPIINVKAYPELNSEEEAIDIPFYLDKLIADGDEYVDDKFKPRRDLGETYMSVYKDKLLSEISEKYINSKNQNFDKIKEGYQPFFFASGVTDIIVYDKKRYKIVDKGVNEEFMITDNDIIDGIKENIIKTNKRTIVTKLKEVAKDIFSGITENDVAITINS